MAKYKGPEWLGTVGDLYLYRLGRPEEPAQIGLSIFGVAIEGDWQGPDVYAFQYATYKPAGVFLEDFHERMEAMQAAWPRLTVMAAGGRDPDREPLPVLADLEGVEDPKFWDFLDMYNTRMDPDELQAAIEADGYAWASFLACMTEWHGGQLPADLEDE